MGLFFSLALHFIHSLFLSPPSTPPIFHPSPTSIHRFIPPSPSVDLPLSLLFIRLQFYLGHMLSLMHTHMPTQTHPQTHKRTHTHTHTDPHIFMSLGCASVHMLPLLWCCSSAAYRLALSLSPTITHTHTNTHTHSHTRTQ